MATIRIGARLFKAAVTQVLDVKARAAKNLSKIYFRAKSILTSYKQLLASFFKKLFKRKPKRTAPLLIGAGASIAVKRKNKRNNKRRKIQQANVIPLANEKIPKPVTNELAQSASNFEQFYEEWQAAWGPALTGLDKDFLESASPEVVARVVENARLTLKSPYLKAVYNGLKDLEDISDLLEKDEFAKQKVLPLFSEYWERGPEKFSEILLCMHDKGVFPTRNGERRLNLDPLFLVPEWLGLVEGDSSARFARSL